MIKSSPISNVGDASLDLKVFYTCIVDIWSSIVHFDPIKFQKWMWTYIKLISHLDTEIGL